jgi:hypothetical protein
MTSLIEFKMTAPRIHNTCLLAQESGEGQPIGQAKQPRPYGGASKPCKQICKKQCYHDQEPELNKHYGKLLTERSYALPSPAGHKTPQHPREHNTYSMQRERCEASRHHTLVLQVYSQAGCLKNSCRLCTCKTRALQGRTTLAHSQRY